MPRSRVLLVAVALAALALRAISLPVYHGRTDGPPPDRLHALAAPFGDDFNGAGPAFLSEQAQSLLREGLQATGGIPLFNMDKAAPADFAWYDHHPPGVALLTALAFKLFGASELVARLVALTFSTVTLVALVAFVQRHLGAGPALASALGLILPPMGWYWATHLDYQVPAIAACTLFLTLSLDENPSRARRIAAACALVLALAFDFLSLLAVVALFVVRLGTRSFTGSSRWKELLRVPLLAGLATALLLAWMRWQVQRGGRSLGGSLKDHVADVWNLPAGVTVKEFLLAVAGHQVDLAGLVGLGVLATALLLPFLVDVPAAARRLLWASTLLALLAGLLPRARALDHPYFQLYLLPAVGIAFGIVAEVLARQWKEAAAPPRHLARHLAWMPLAALAIVEGVHAEFARPPADPTRPSCHLLGRELAASVPPQVRVVALPADSRFIEFVPQWYAGRIVLRLNRSPPARADLQPTLAFLGLADAQVWLAQDPVWPGRGGFTPLE